MSWLKEVIGTEKAIISMLHLQAMPGDPYYNKEKGIKWVVEKAREDLDALQEGGVDAIMFSNEYSLPYLTEVKRETVAAMGRITPAIHNGAVWRECFVGSESLSRFGRSRGCQIHKRDIYRSIRKRFRTLEHLLRGGGKASEGDRSGECQAFV